MQRRAKIVMITMFRNESRVIRRMLESCAPYIDYWVIQDNGSTDGTPDIVREFFRENPIPGHLYVVEEGWKGFGWNRDHLLQTCQAQPHGCDWILKMDCDEVLEVDPAFDWSVLDDISVQAWNVAAVSGPCIYYRMWLWNARLPWRFNHDPCHETIYSALPDIGPNIQARDLDAGFRQVGYNEGQSWSVPSKFATDALVLEEQMIRENTMLTNMYHFFYIGKSYNDGCRGDYFPLGRPHQIEYARRAVWYLDQWITYTMKDRQSGTNEMVYVALLMMAECLEFMDDPISALHAFRRAEPFAEPRNDHLWGQARILERLNRWEEMLEITQRMMQPQRICPFPAFGMFIDQSLYHDKSDRVIELHRRAETMVTTHRHKTIYQRAHETPMPQDRQSVSEDAGSAPLVLNSSRHNRMWIVDDFYQDPDSVREFAMAQEFQADIRWYKGLRTRQQFRPWVLRQAFERIMGVSISNWDDHGYNGCFQITTAEDPQVYHHDTQRWAAMIYLTPDAPITSGTRLHRSRINQARHWSQGQDVMDQAFSVGFYDSTKWDTIDSAGNLYNRLVIMDAQHIHSAGDYFGTAPETGRLTHLFFFD